MKKIFIILLLSMFISMMLFSGNFIDKKNNSLIEFKTVKELTKLLKKYAKSYPDLDSKKKYFFIIESTGAQIKKLGKKPEKFDFIFDEKTRFYSNTNEALNSKEIRAREYKTGMSFFVIGYSHVKNKIINIVDIHNKLVYGFKKHKN